MVETVITMHKLLFKDTLAIKEYTIDAHMKFEDEKLQKERNTNVITKFTFVEFLPLSVGSKDENKKTEL